MKHPIPIYISIVMSVLAVIGWTLHWHLTINNTNVPHVTQAFPNDGTMSVMQCMSLKTGTTETDLVAQYGMPKGDNQDNGSTDAYLWYPLAENGSRNCMVDFGVDSRKINSVSIDVVDPTQ